METVVSKRVSSVAVGVPSMGVTHSRFRFPPHQENNEASQPARNQFQELENQA